MRPHLALSASAFATLLLAGLAPPAAQAQPRPPGSYERLCTNITMNGPFLSATCRGARGPGTSSLNAASCRGDIGVDAEGGLICAGPGVAPPPPLPGRPPPGPGPGPGPRPPWDDGRPGRDSATLFGGRDLRGPSVTIDGPMPNLDRTGLNDRVRSIAIDRRSGPWLVCEDANFRGRCVTISRSVSDTRAIGMNRAISSLRPLR